MSVKIGASFVAASLLFIVAALPGAAQTRTLYDSAIGTTPGSQGWTFFAPGGTEIAPQPTQPYTVLDTTAINSLRGGYTQISPLALDRIAGYSIRLDLGVEQEAHNGVDRAGLSTIVIGSDKRGIELGFWRDRVFAQNDGIAADDGKAGTTLFTHGEEASLNTSFLTRYDLQVQGDSYNLLANGTGILSGKLRDYTAFNGPINPYRVADDLFVGDDTTSAGARSDFAYASVSVTAAPEWGSLPLAVCGLLPGVFCFRFGAKRCSRGVTR